MPLKFTQGTPQMLRKLARLWWRRVGAQEWTLQISVKPETEFAATNESKEYALAYLSVRHVLQPYIDAQVSINEYTLTRDEGFIRDTLVHEMRHLHYAKIAELMKFLYESKHSATQDIAQKLIADLVEEMIERDVALFREAYRGK
jgi:hypothetical protein